MATKSETATKGKTTKVQALPHSKSSLHVGKIYDLPDAQAKKLVKMEAAKYTND